MSVISKYVRRQCELEKIIHEQYMEVKEIHKVFDTYILSDEKLQQRINKLSPTVEFTSIDMSQVYRICDMIADIEISTKPIPDNRYHISDKDAICLKKHVMDTLQIKGKGHVSINSGSFCDCCVDSTKGKCNSFNGCTIIVESEDDDPDSTLCTDSKSDIKCVLEDDNSTHRTIGMTDSQVVEPISSMVEGGTEGKYASLNHDILEPNTLSPKEQLLMILKERKKIWLSSHVDRSYYSTEFKIRVAQDAYLTKRLGSNGPIPRGSEIRDEQIREQNI